LANHECEETQPVIVITVSNKIAFISKLSSLKWPAASDRGDYHSTCVGLPLVMCAVPLTLLRMRPISERRELSPVVAGPNLAMWSPEDANIRKRSPLDASSDTFHGVITSASELLQSIVAWRTASPPYDKPCPDPKPALSRRHVTTTKYADTHSSLRRGWRLDGQTSLHRF